MAPPPRQRQRVREAPRRAEDSEFRGATGRAAPASATPRVAQLRPGGRVRRRRHRGACSAEAGSQVLVSQTDGSASAAVAANRRQAAFPPRLLPRPLTGSCSTCQPSPWGSAELLRGEPGGFRCLLSHRAAPSPRARLASPHPRSHSGGSLPPWAKPPRSVWREGAPALSISWKNAYLWRLA